MADTHQTLDVFDIQALLKYLPHRYPMLMIDRIVRVDSDRSAVGVKNVTFNEPQFMGHFPGRPVMPGVLLIEGMAQTAGAICIAAQPGDSSALVYFMTIDQAKFRKPVVPGDTVEYHMQQLKKRKNIWKFSGVAMVNGDKVAEAVISAMMVTGQDAI
ncbi:MAG: 3-hydroxyacyl-ACP dehydratase FabZ [Alphaproteobacteria bacterium]